MNDASDGTTYADWLTQASAPDETARLTAEHIMVVLYDATGRPQRVRGSGIKGMLAKRDSDGNPVFLTEAP